MWDHLDGPIMVGSGALSAFVTLWGSSADVQIRYGRVVWAVGMGIAAFVAAAALRIELRRAEAAAGLRRKSTLRK